jgi:hypothetical protein
MTTRDHLPTMTTFTGKIFNFIEPDPGSICIEDIAHALSLECRFQNQSKVHYSVAQHSIIVSRLVLGAPAPIGMSHTMLRRIALMHDAAEAYLGDVCKPLKRLLPDYQVIEDRVQKAIFRHFRLPKEVPPVIKLWDAKLLANEWIQFMGPDWHDAMYPPDPSIGVIEAWSAVESESQFLKMHELLFDPKLFT